MMAGHAIRKGGSRRQAISKGLQEMHEAAPRISHLQHIKPDPELTLDVLRKRVAQVRPTQADVGYLSRLWHSAGNGVFFDTLVASTPK